MAGHRRLGGIVAFGPAAALLLVSVLLVLGGCSGSDKALDETTSPTVPATTVPATETAPLTVAEIAPELAVFGDLAAIEAPPVSADFDSAGGRLDLADGATVTVPAGAFADDTSLSVTVVGLALGYLDRRVGVASTYVIESDRDLSSLPEPVILEIPFPSEICGVAVLEDGQWIGVDIPVGETTHIEISHFSRNLITFIPAATEFIQQLGWTLGKSGGWLKPSDAERVAMEEKHQQWVRTRADQWTRDFYGLDEKGEYRPPTHTQEEMCRELQAALGAYTDFSLPEDYNWLPGVQMDQRINEFELFRFLIAADNPRTMGSWFWDYTNASMDVMDRQVRGSSAPLTPAEMLKIAIDANGGNVPLGLLAAHNYLKDIAYGGRLQGDPGTEGAQSNIAQGLGEAASHLEPWREVVPTNSVGRLDKMGPIYHIFAAAVAEVWWREKAAGSQNMGEIVSLGEQLMRVGFFTAFAEKTGIPINAIIDDAKDVPDVDKGAADLCGARLGQSVVALARGEKPPAMVEETPEPEIDTDGIQDGVYVGEVYTTTMPDSPIWEILESSVELEVTEESIAAELEYVLRYAARSSSTRGVLCTATIRVSYSGRGSMTKPLPLTLELVDSEIVSIEGSECGAGGSWKNTAEEDVLANLNHPSFQTCTLDGRFSDGGFVGEISPITGVKATRVAE